MSIGMAQLIDVCGFVMGQSPPSSTYNTSGDGLPFFQGKTDFGEMYPSSRVYCNSPVRVAEIGDVLISVRAPVGPTNVVRNRCCIGRGLAALRAGGGLDMKYLLYFLRHHEPRLAQLGQGSTFEAINRDDLEEIQIPLPSLPEQHRIAAQLEAADRLRRTRRYTLELSDSFLPATFRLLFGDPVQNPKGWPVVTVDEAGVVQLGRQRAPKYQTGKYRKPYIRVANVYENEIDLSDLLSMDFGPSDYPAYKLEYGDILLNEGQSTELVGRPAMWRCEIPDCCFQNTLVRFQADRKICDPSYALWLFLRYLKAGEFAKISSKTSSVAHLGAQRFAEMKFPLPPLAQQQHFATLVTQHERLRATQRESLRQADHLFQTLLHRAFSA